MLRTLHSVRFFSNIPLSYSVESVASAPSGKTPIIILHGLLGSKQNWRSLAKLLSQHLQNKVITVDLRNHGESPHVAYTPGTAYQDMAQDVVRLMEQLQIPKAHLIGHSMGGKVGCYLALKHPSIVDSLVSVDIAPITYNDNDVFRNYLKELERVNSLQLKSKREVDQMLKQSIPDASVRQLLLTNLVTNEDTSTLAVRNNIKALLDSMDEIRAFPNENYFPFFGKTLCLIGKKASYVRDEGRSIIKKLFSNAQFLELETGHWVHAEQPHQFLNAVENFLKQTETTPSLS